jgi:hypothetical protein
MNSTGISDNNVSNRSAPVYKQANLPPCFMGNRGQISGKFRSDNRVVNLAPVNPLNRINEAFFEAGKIAVECRNRIPPYLYDVLLICS